MRAFRLVRWQEPPALTEVPVPEPGPGEVRVRVAGVGLCHSDLTMIGMPREVGEPLGWRVPFTLGHETAGWVDAVGRGAQGVAVGDAVALVSPWSCGTCPACRRGADNVCPSGVAGRGYGRDGGLADYVLARAPRDLVPLQGLDPVEAGVLTDAGATSYRAVARAVPRLLPDDTAVVVGAGGLGAFAVQLLRRLTQARVVAVDPSPVRRSAAAALGAHVTVDGIHDDGAATLRAEVPGGAGAVLDFVGSDLTITTGISVVRPGGVFGLVGAAGGRLRHPWFGALPRDGEVFAFQNATIADTHAVVALAASGALRIDVERFPLERVADAYAALDEGRVRGRAVVVP
jgi:propanol-preferring alcohol dehydrogenase